MTAVAEQVVGDAALEVRELSVSYGGTRAVDDVSFTVAPGSIIGLIGPNGAGKTTVFDAICGFVQADGGRVFVHGDELTNLAPTDRARRGLGRSFQDARLFASLTVYETLACALERHTRGQDLVSAALGLPWSRGNERRVSEKVEELIEVMSLTAFRDKFISELSTGSRRVVDLACTLAHAPRVLLLDEPSSGMAQKESEAMAPLLVRVREVTGCTMLLVEHDMPLVTAVSDELIAMETGRLIARGKPKQVTNDPRVVEAYLGTDERIVARSGARSTKSNSKRSRKAAGKKSAKANVKRPTKANAKRPTKANVKRSKRKPTNSGKRAAPTSRATQARKGSAKGTRPRKRS